MSSLHFVVPGDLRTATGGYVYARRLVAGLDALGWAVRVHRLSASFPHPDEPALAQAAGTLAALADGASVVIDGLAFGTMPEVARREAARLRLIALIHHPLALETGLSAEHQAKLLWSERLALASARRVIVSSPRTARDLAAYGVGPERIGIVPPGTDAAPFAVGSGEPGCRLLCVATLTPRKGHDVLVRALGRVRKLPWSLICVGSDQRPDSTAPALRRLIRNLGLETRIELAGEMSADGLAALYHRADLVALASWHEGYGMALAEALARGLPVVSTRAGAIPETVPGDAGILVPPGDVDALSEALALLLDDTAARARLAAGARRARTALPDWAETAERFAAEIRTVESGSSSVRPRRPCGTTSGRHPAQRG